jgi:hypothetical protein
VAQDAHQWGWLKEQQVLEGTSGRGLWASIWQQSEGLPELTESKAVNAAALQWRRDPLVLRPIHRHRRLQIYQTCGGGGSGSSGIWTMMQQTAQMSGLLLLFPQLLFLLLSLPLLLPLLLQLFLHF